MGKSPPPLFSWSGYFFFLPFFLPQHPREDEVPSSNLDYCDYGGLDIMNMVEVKKVKMMVFIYYIFILSKQFPHPTFPSSPQLIKMPNPNLNVLPKVV